MITDRWPLFGLVLRTPRLELRVPGLDRPAEPADLAATGVHDPGVQPFTAEWTDRPPGEVARSVRQVHWAGWGAWRPADWSPALVAIADGQVVGTQSLDGRDFAVLREAGTGSWLGRAHVIRGVPTVGRRLRLDQPSWLAARQVPVGIEGLTPCREMFGLQTSAGTGGLTCR